MDIWRVYMLEIRDVLDLLGKELKDSGDEPGRFRQFIEQEKWGTEQVEKWLNECINTSSSDNQYKRAYNLAFQDIIISLGQRLGFDVEYGRYVGKADGANYDGIWRRSNGDIIVIEVKAGTWAMGGISQLGDYLTKISNDEKDKNVVGLYVIGNGDIQPLIQQILGSNYKDNMRIILYDDLMKILTLKEELEPVIGEENALKKVQNILLPIESINIGNIIGIITEIAATKTAVAEETIDEVIPKNSDDENMDNPWIKAELIPYLNDSTDYQRLLLASLVQTDNEPIAKKKVIFMMTEIAKRRLSEDVDKITGYTIAGSRAGLKMRRKPLKKEDIIDASYSHYEYYYKIKEDYKKIIEDWIKKENLWIKEEIE